VVIAVVHFCPYVLVVVYMQRGVYLMYIPNLPSNTYCKYIHLCTEYTFASIYVYTFAYTFTYTYKYTFTHTYRSDDKALVRCVGGKTS